MNNAICQGARRKVYLTRFNKVCPDSEQQLARAQACVKGKGFSAHLSLLSDVDIPGVWQPDATVLTERFPLSQALRLAHNIDQGHDTLWSVDLLWPTVRLCK